MATQLTSSYQCVMSTKKTFYSGGSQGVTFKIYAKQVDSNVYAYATYYADYSGYTEASATHTLYINGTSVGTSNLTNWSATSETTLIGEKSISVGASATTFNISLNINVNYHTNLNGTYSGAVTTINQNRTITVKAGDNYTTVSGGGTVSYGGSCTITATPNTGYAFDKWNDGDTNTSRTLTNITANATYTAYSKYVSPTITLNASRRVPNYDDVGNVDDTSNLIYISLSVTKGSADITSVTCDSGTLTSSDTTYIVKDTLEPTSSKTYTFTITDSVVTRTYSVYINAGPVPFSLFTGNDGSVGVGIETYGEANALSFGKDMKIVATNGTTKKEISVYEMLTKLGV